MHAFVSLNLFVPPLKQVLAVFLFSFSDDKDIIPFDDVLSFIPSTTLSSNLDLTFFPSLLTE